MPLQVPGVVMKRISAETWYVGEFQESRIGKKSNRALAILLLRRQSMQKCHMLLQLSFVPRVFFYCGKYNLCSMLARNLSYVFIIYSEIE